jgi:hypothetical protein
MGAVLTSHAVSDPALTLPAANVRQPGDFPDDQFQTIRDVPVFTEHETKARDGRVLRFSLPELQAVCERCNRRIAETNDYAAVTLGHTPDPGDANAELPPVVGFAGPFRIGELGRDGQRKRYAILADFHIYKEDVTKLKKYPRRSPEVWLEDSYEEMFLDPIALLGSAAPRLDMGLLYSAQRGGRVIEKYAAVAGGPMNTSPRTTGDDDSKRTAEHHSFNFGKKKEYQAGEPADNTERSQEAENMLSPEDLQQIIEAFEQLDWVQGIKAQLAQTAGLNSSVPGMSPQSPPPEALAPPTGAPLPAAPVAGPEPLPAAPPEAGPPGPGLGDAPGPELPSPSAAEPTSAGPPDAPPADPDKEKMMGGKHYGADSPTGEYQTADIAEGADGRKAEHVEGSPFTGPDAGKKYSADDFNKMDDDEYDKMCKGRKDYQAGRLSEGSQDTNTSQPASDPTIDEDEMAKTGSEDTDGSDPATGEYQEAQPPAKYSRMESQLAGTQKQVAELQKQLNVERSKRVDTERYSQLREKGVRLAFDIDKEFERCRYSKMTAETFSDHLESMENYRQIPINEQLPVGFGDAAASMAPDRPGKGNGPEKYSMENRQKALDYCVARRLKGEDADYVEAVEAFQRGETPA